VGITQQGHWFRYRGDAARILDDTWCNPHHCTPAFISPCRQHAGLVEFGTGVTVFTRLDAAFPVMHGTFGEDGTVQGLLELAGIPIVGCGTLASAACMDKNVAHKPLQAAGIAVPQSATFGGSTDFTEIEAAAKALGFPLFVKPVRAGSSFGVSRVANATGLAGAVQKAFLYDDHLLLEEAIDGFEVGCAVLGNKDLTIGALDEIELAGGFFDYTEKYNLVTSKIHVPARLPAEKTDEIKQIAANIYRLLGCKGFARVDMFVTPEGRVVFNEVNTVPGFTPHSRYPTMMQAVGLDFTAVVDRLVTLAVAP